MGPNKNSTRQYSKWGAEIMERAIRAGLANMNAIAEKARDIGSTVSRGAVANAMKLTPSGKEPNPTKSTTDWILRAVESAEKEKNESFLDSVGGAHFVELPKGAIYMGKPGSLSEGVGKVILEQRREEMRIAEESAEKDKREAGGE